ncbi:hypothetical protein [Actinoplanes sp. CA-252034]|uniref:hypothetical protein n=1 Tax=Actinoplanes sp. CA-252034 TaxID=3239906 RepID=UPI003D999411
MAESDGVIGDAPLVDGMDLSVRLRFDFVVTDAERLLATARRLYQELYPGATAADAEESVSCAADALFVVLEHAGVFGPAVDDRLAGYLPDGLKAGGVRAEAVPNEPWPLSTSPRGDCLRSDNVFAVPPYADLE